MRAPLLTLYLTLLCSFPPLLQAVENHLNIESVFMDFNYAEFSNADILLDEENGLLAGLALQHSLSNTTNRMLTRLQYFNGQVNYDGQTQDGIAFRTNTDEILYSLSVKQLFKHPNEPRLEWLLGIELWFWQRDILSRSGVQGLFEKYQWQELSAGVSMHVLQKPQQNAWLEAQFLQILSPQMRIQLDDGFGRVSLGRKPGYRVRFIYRQTLSPQWRWQAQVFIQYIEFGKSNRIAVNGFFGQSVVLSEPRSVSQHRGVSLGLQYSFEL